MKNEIIEEGIRDFLSQLKPDKPLWAQSFTERADIKIVSAVLVHDRIWMVRAQVSEGETEEEHSGIFLTQERLQRAQERLRDRKIDDLLNE